ncbi:hypothetical protein QE152_g8090 [Popillia japonica]|uniref:Uncharacterized protein n=1 Tax=Popillia japonica TaxID=7064 RepID=A0AAW1MCX3_POPJA
MDLLKELVENRSFVAATKGQFLRWQQKIAWVLPRFVLNYNLMLRRHAYAIEATAGEFSVIVLLKDLIQRYTLQNEDRFCICPTCRSVPTAEPPTCQCEKAPIIARMTDNRGIWCNGADENWPCENVDEWNKYESECKDVLHCIPNSNNN